MFSDADANALRRLLSDYRAGRLRVGVTPPLTLTQGADKAVLGVDASGLVAAGGDGTDDAGFTDVCQVVSGGTVTAVKRRVRYGRMFRCVTIDDCCLSDYRCVSNSQLTFTPSGGCCSPATVTRIIRLAFTGKTGDCADLPDLVYLTYSSGLTWTNGAADFWGTRQYTGSVTFACVGGSLKATLTMSGFTGGATATVPCDLTSAGVSLGTFTYSGSSTDSCGNVTALSGTVAVSVSAWEDGGGAAVTGVVAFGENEVPPWDAGPPFKTQLAAQACCPEVLVCGVGCTGTFPGVIRFAVSGRTGVYAGMPDTIVVPVLLPAVNAQGTVYQFTGTDSQVYQLTASCGPFCWPTPPPDMKVGFNMCLRTLAGVPLGSCNGLQAGTVTPTGSPAWYGAPSNLLLTDWPCGSNVAAWPGMSSAWACVTAPTAGTFTLTLLP